MKRFIQPFFLLIFCVVILGLSLRGISGNATSSVINEPRWKEDGPFELSPERGRFALALSLLENKSFTYSLPIARFAIPDLAISNGNYVSLFAPAVSFVIIPGIIIGNMYGAGQVGAFAVISIFALLNVLILRSLAIKIKADPLAATIGALLFIFATPAFTYSVNLYQHHISTFLILSSLYLLVRWKNWLSLSLIWLLFAASIPVDYPNLILMFPIVLVATARIIWIEKTDTKKSLKINFYKMFTPIAMFLPLLFYIWFSQNSYGKPLQLSGTLESVKSIDADGRPSDRPGDIQGTIKRPEDEAHKKTATGFFQTRNLLNGFYTHFLSKDRGMIYYTPVMIFGFIGLVYSVIKKTKYSSVLVSIIGANILLYSMWGDPWGGWAFGSRYLIPSYAILSIFIALLITQVRRKLLILIPLTIVSVYSIAVNALGAITTSALPPRDEVLYLEKISGMVQKYTFEKNWDLIRVGVSKSYVYQTYFSDYITALNFYRSITISICLVIGLLIFYYYISSRKKGGFNV